jgi:hypothetical protein
MKFEIDVLIIFADRDNVKTDGSSIGWVSQFRKFLELMLSQVFGEESNIVLKGEFDSITSPTLDNAATLVAILSTDFIQSGSCLDYTEAFFNASKDTPKNINRLFKVFKNPLAVAEQPPRLRDLFGYDMYQLDPDSGQISEYTNYFSPSAERQYWMKMVDLAYDIYDTLLRLKGDPSKNEVKTIYNRKTIYLAETGHDLSVQRSIIKRELQRHGYLVLPAQASASNVADLEKAVTDDLQASNVSVHLIGASYGEIPEGSDISVIEIQNNLAALRSKQARHDHTAFSQLIWINPDLSKASEKQQSFVERIKRDIETQEGVEILQTPMEDFKNIMWEELLDAGDRSIAEQSDKPTVYLIYDRVDEADIEPFAKAIEDAGFKVLVPEFEGEILDLRRKHIENLRKFDAAVIYKGKVNEQWVRMKVLDLLKAPGFGRKKPIVGKALIASPASLSNPESFKNQNIRVSEGDRQRSIDSLKMLLDEFFSE